MSVLHHTSCTRSTVVRILSHAAVGAALLLTGSATPAAIVTSLRPLGFIAAAIADGVIPVEVVLPDGASPHNYALRPSDIMRVKQANLLVWIGPELEAFLVSAASTLPADKRIILANTPTITSLLMKSNQKFHGKLDRTDKQSSNTKEPGHHHGKYNMHLWLSPVIAHRTAVAIHDRLTELMPEKKQQLDDNLQNFSAVLTKKNKILATMLAPVSGKGYYVFHDAYGYFEKHYGLTPLGYFTINPEIQPGAQALHKIRIQLIKQKAICIFAEPQFRPAIIKAVARGTGVHIGTLDLLGSYISLDKDSYLRFLLQLTNQYLSCLEKNI
ncbi:MAG: Zn(2(+)) ABC transporter periplasmic binding protein [Sodalis sp. Fse]|nr:MAG: Zn(2(+)) ABC transporter periplasmic binding protein [Sodalis sp. Fle]UVK77612.1 MAG: Zn(2(+)) ABC transporter periplasmic binding protein [Sodalis sp. Fse]UVK78855.1 MAG: Zn(2(+)) ABC transporter periplasmic binding protein [Sodalis sp. Ffu]